MAKTATMRLVELMIMKEDVDPVIEYLGKKAVFQFYLNNSDSSSKQNSSKEIFENLQFVRSCLDIPDLTDYKMEPVSPKPEDFTMANQIISEFNELREKEIKAKEELKRIVNAHKEALAFKNLKMPYSDLEHLSFLTMRIGKIDPVVFDNLQFSLGENAVLIPLGEDKTRVMAAAPRKLKSLLDKELEKFGFIPLEIPEDFTGVSDEMLRSLEEQCEAEKNAINNIAKELIVYEETNKELLLELLQKFSVGMQVQFFKDKLEGTQLVYRVTGWIPEHEAEKLIKELDNLTEGRIAVRQYEPKKVAGVRSGNIQVPVAFKHGKFVKSFEGMVFSYGAPKYGSIDPTPFVAVFFTLLFGIMFGDAGQGLVLILIGVILHFNLIKIGNWNKYSLVFISIGISSFIMGLLTGEFFANSDILRPFGYFVTGLFVGKENAFAPIFHLMPSKETMPFVFIFFGFTLSVGFIINSLGLIINFINNISKKKYGAAFFGKTGLCGMLFFWYVVALAIRIFAFKHQIAIFDLVFIGLTLIGVFFAHPLGRLTDREYPVLENGFLSAVIEGFVEIIEVISTYLSNTVSFLRVGAFALAHVVLGYIIFEMNKMIGGVGGLAVVIIGNIVVIVLEGMIVAIQVLRLQYYEFFSKFFSETGVEFKPFQFKYKAE